jgi:hypothetical protein
MTMPFMQRQPPIVGSRIKVWLDKVSKDLLIENETFDQLRRRCRHTPRPARRVFEPVSL